MHVSMHVCVDVCGKPWPNTDASQHKLRFESKLQFALDVH